MVKMRLRLACTMLGNELIHKLIQTIFVCHLVLPPSTERYILHMGLVQHVICDLHQSLHIRIARIIHLRQTPAWYP
jgi:hypothetical protein